ncbi:MAG: Multi-sensor hybrid histidine kinase [Candidatus Moranbacteria bacterium GW2011_GWE1_49_15]|nr:MAG: Multi-sensor hybrid histidine kinase [Candidatus Moranbacteria bacterium GW2011_GWE2_47_10]KKW07614.1 MAG: Multi-sensor hybrid histidine kinase [Candidatus Moranbacteria bacterium GW2011_GWE1_49_15]HBP01052.1 hypothetical protein [Candidatus Moranbacteria bacterium]
MAKILLVEDDQMIADIYRNKFESAGFDFVNAKTGKEVLKYVGMENFDLVLLDMVLPEMSGMDVLKEIKRSGNYDKNIRVIIFSNLNPSDVQKEALENGAEGFIGKMQYTPSELVVEIRRLLNQYSEQDKNRNRKDGNSSDGARKGKLLLIEDEEIFLEMFGKKLEDDGYEVVKANNGAWGIKEVANGNYDLIITDMVMPAMTGEEIISRLKADEKTKNIPIIAISASVPDEKIEGVKAMGVAEFFLKTHIVPSDLSRKVGELLKK